MMWASAISDRTVCAEAIDEVIAKVGDELGGRAPHALFAFASPELLAQCPELPARISGAFAGVQLVGCTGGGIIGGGREIERAPALSLVAAHLRDARVRAIHLEPGASATTLTDVDPGSKPCVVLLPEPSSCDPEELATLIEREHPGTVIVGGVPSGGPRAVLCGKHAHRTGAAMMVLEGVEVDTIIAQGCRPIGEPMLVTDCDQNRIYSLDGRKPGMVIRELYDSLPVRDKNLFRHSLFVGIEMTDQRQYRHGDFLVRNMLGLDAEGTTLAVAALLERYMAVQFHLRDAQTSAQDLAAHLDRYVAERGRDAVRGALLFSCLGRGEHLYGVPNHDSDQLRAKLGDVPVGGFFCNGEIGPVGGKIFVHGYTSAFSIFRETARDEHADRD